MLGQTVGRYRIVRLLGSGGMGDVYLATDTRLGRQVALKFLSAELARDPQALARFENEARAAAELSHPNVAAIYDVDEADGRRFLVLEYVQGTTLQARLDEHGQLPVDEVAALAGALAEALAHAHARSIVHRDIKAANVMLTPGGIKVLDFGLARRSGESQLTLPGSSLGTVSHMSPEQARGHAVDGRTDLWSLGIVLYQCLTGRLPFAGEQPLAVIHQILNEPPVRPTLLRPDTPVALERVVLRCLEKDPRQRFQDATQLLAALRGETAPGAAPPAARGAGFLRELWRRRVVQTAAGYAVAGWLAVLALGWLVGRARLSPAWIAVEIALLALLSPAVVLSAWWRAGAGRPPAKRRRMLIGLNAAVAAVLVFLLFRGRDLGAVATTVTVTDEQGKTTEHLVPKSQYRQHVALFVLDPAGADTTIGWACYGVPQLMLIDLLQDPFVVASGLSSFLERLRQAGFPEGRGVPRALQRKLAGEMFCPTFVSGTLARAPGGWTMTAIVQDTRQGRERARTTLAASDLFALVDQATLWLRRQLDIPEAHLQEQADVPVADLTTSSEAAWRAYIEGEGALQLRNDYPGSTARFQQAIDADPEFTLAQFAQYQACSFLADAGRATAAIEAAMRGLYRLPERIQFWIKTAYYFNEKRDPDKALAVSHMWEQLHPDDLQAQVQLAQLYYLRGQSRAAIAACQRALELDPTQRAMLQQIGRLYAELAVPDTAEVYYKQYAEQAPDDARSFSALAELYEDTGRLDDALQNSEKALLLDGSLAGMQVARARLLSKAGKLEEAAGALDEAAGQATSPSDRADVQRALMNQFQRRGQLGHAMAAREAWLREAAAALPPAQVAIFGLISLDLLAAAHQLDRADAVIASARASLPPTLRPLTALGTLAIYSELGIPDSVEAAIPEVNRFIETFKMDPLRPVSIMAQARVAELRGQWDAALAQYQKALARDPTAGDALRRAAACHRQAGRLDEARRLLEKGLVLDPYAPRTNVEMARVLLAGGDRARAREHVQRALSVWAQADLGYVPRREAQELLQQIDAVP